MLILNYSAKLVQTERNAKQKTKFFVCITEVQPHLAIYGKMQTERNAKQKTKFFVLQR